MKKAYNILVTGSNGQLGHEIQISATHSAHNFYFLNSSNLDVTNFEKVTSFFSQNKLDFCINCAAYTAVDKAESEQEKANLINNLALKNLAKICNEHQIKLIHVSTDFVFDGMAFQPYVEDSCTNPLGVYGCSKLKGEEHVLNIQGIVIRTSWLYSSFGNNFVKTMLKLASSRNELSVIFDQIGTPTYAAHLSNVILKIIENENVSLKEGIYHFSNEGVASWYDFAHAIFTLKNLNIKLNSIETKDYPTPAKRPHYSVLNKAKIKADFNLEILHWRDALEECLEKFKV